MPVLRKKSNKRAARRTLSLGKAFLLGLGEAAELTLRAFYAHPYYHTFCHHGHHRKSGYMALRRLEREGFVISKTDAPRTFLLTRKGKKIAGRLRSLFVSQAELEVERWDGKWRVLVFDVPERRRRERDFLRAELRQHGFQKLQRSVWITPFRVVENFVERLNALGRFGRNVEFMVVESLSNAERLKKLFNLRGLVQGQGNKILRS